MAYQAAQMRIPDPVQPPPGPVRPQYQAAYDPATMSLMPDFLKQQQAGQAGFDAFRGEALRKGQSSWAGLAKSSAALEAAKARNQAAQQAGSSGAQAMDALAMRGGLSSGARERAAQGSARNYLGMAQNIAGEQAAGNLKTSMADEQRRMEALGQLPGMENQRTDAWSRVRSADLANLMGERKAKSAWDMDLYKELMQQQAAERQAAAMRQASRESKRGFHL